jgi:uncharacterized protein
MDDLAALRNEAANTPEHEVWTRGGPVSGHLSQETVHGLEGVAMATFGDAASVGMWAFASGALMAGLFQANVFPSSAETALFPVLLAYPGAVLLIAGLLLFRRNNNLLASSFCSFASLNLARGALLLSVSRGFLPPAAPIGAMQGILFEVFAYLALTLLIGALKLNAVLVATLACTAVGFFLAGLSSIAGPGGAVISEAGRIGGFFMIAAALFAFYGGSAILVNTAWRRAIAPIGGQM